MIVASPIERPYSHRRAGIRCRHSGPLAWHKSGVFLEPVAAGVWVSVGSRLACVNGVEDRFPSRWIAHGRMSAVTDTPRRVVAGFCLVYVIDSEAGSAGAVWAASSEPAWGASTGIITVLIHRH